MVRMTAAKRRFDAHRFKASKLRAYSGFRSFSPSVCVTLCLPLMIRTGGFAKQSSGSAALETKGFAWAGRGLQAARDC